MTDIQAALGLSQMSRLDSLVARRHQIASRYDSALSSLPIIIPLQASDTYSSYHLYPIRINKNCSGRVQREIYDILWQCEIAANIHYIPVHRQPFYEKLGFAKGEFPEAEEFHKEVLSLPIFPTLGEGQDKVIASLRDVFNQENTDE